MEITDLFAPLDIPDLIPGRDQGKSTRIGHIIKSYINGGSFPDWHQAHIALIGVTDDRGAVDNKGCAEGPDAIRKYLYNLTPGPYSIKIADLGNIITGYSHRDTCFALSTVMSTLLNNHIVPVVLGGSQDMTYAIYEAYQRMGLIINIVAIDPVFDLGRSEEELNSQSYLSHILLHQPNFLFNYTNIGYQTYFVEQEALKLMQNLFFDSYRLGMVRENLQDVEPMVRNADVLSFDISAIRHSDAPGNGNASPHGFYGEEACLICRYAGMSDKLSSIGFFEINPLLDPSGQTAHLTAQMIWYFIDGYYNRANDFPFISEDNYLKYRVSIHDHQEEIVFYKSKKTDRWWMEIPLPEEQKIKFERHYLVPCGYQDYQTACNNEIPDRWWMAYQKLM